VTDAARALLLDLDGTIADTLPVLVETYEQFIRAFGAEPSMDEFTSLNGIPLERAVDSLRRTHRLPGDTPSLTERYEAAIDELYLSAPAREGAHTLLSTAQRNGWRCGVVTSGTRARALAWLATAGLGVLVDELVAAEDVRSGKPDPEPYRTGLRLLHALPEHSIAVEDSELGALAARDAGIETYVLSDDGVPPGCTAIRELADVTARLRSRALG
jgi:HAD superfamily hydrolase (TIGR01509 family)